MSFNNSVDEKNAGLLSELETNGVQIEFEVQSRISWGVQARPRFGIAAPDNNPNPEMFAHELLHIKLNILGFLPTDIITDIFDEGNCRFDTKEIGNIQNLLAHLKMFPLFFNMGYLPEKFTANHGNDFFLNQLIPSTVKVAAFFGLNKASSSKPRIELVTEFISLIICIKQCETEHLITGNENIDTQALINELRSADEDLFSLVYTELTNWTDAKTFKNYNLYNNLNYRLMQLGYPSQANWESWLLSA